MSEYISSTYTHVKLIPHNSIEITALHQQEFKSARIDNICRKILSNTLIHNDDAIISHVEICSRA